MLSQKGVAIAESNSESATHRRSPGILLKKSIINARVDQHG